jgi:hypothetical protein
MAARELHMPVSEVPVSRFKFDAEGLQEARKFLHEEQRKYPTPAGVRQEMLGQSTLQPALAALDTRRKFESGEMPCMVVRDGMAFNREPEMQRIALAEELIRRSDPGPFEDPRYLALLAYQAASIEMALPDTLTQGLVGERWSSVLLGTIHVPQIDSFEQSLFTSDYAVVCVYSALMEFAYQAAKAVTPVLSAHLRGRGLAVGALDDKEIERRVANDPEPAERLYRTLEAYFFNGYPRAFVGETVPQEQVPLLTYLIDMTERWVIAHEYGHAVGATFHTVLGSRWRTSQYSEEYFADMNATILTALSAGKLDGVPPDFALIGGTFALACLEVVRRSLAMVREGKVGPDRGDDKHPPTTHRASFISDIFNHHVLVSNENYGPSGFDVAFVANLKGAPDLDPATIEDRHKRVFQFPTALLAIWRSIRTRLRDDFTKGRELHSIWQKKMAHPAS